MDINGLARAAVDTVARHLAQRGTDSAGRLVNAAVDRVYQLIDGRLRGHRAGRQALDTLLRDPGDPSGRAMAADLVSREAHTNQRFAHALGGAAERAGIFVQGAGASYRVEDNRIDNSGDFRNFQAGGDIRIKQNRKHFHIGRIQFGTGGLISGIAVLVLVLGGGTAAVINATSERVSLSSAVGRWERPGETPAPGFETGPAVLTVDAGGRFTFTMDVRMTSVPGGGPVPSGQVQGLPDLDLNCGGTVDTAGDHFTLRSTTGPCGTFDAKLSSDGKVIDLFLSADGSSNGSLSLRKA
jgi:hypothetical protein